MPHRGQDMWAADSDRDANPYWDEPPLQAKPPVAPAACRCCRAITFAYLFCPVCDRLYCTDRQARCGRKD